MNTLTKIERDGKSEEVNKMIASGITSASQIRLILSNSGYKISKSAVTTYLKRVVDKIKPEALKIVSDHIDNVIPEDMKALEAMEVQLLDWAAEDPIDAADRLAEARAGIARDVGMWTDNLTLPGFESDPGKREKEKERRIQWIMKKSLSYILMDSRLQKKRIEAMNAAIRIIGLKLQHIAILEGEGKGNIIIMDSSADYHQKKDGELVPFLIKGEGPDDSK